MNERTKSNIMNFLLHASVLRYFLLTLNHIFPSPSAENGVVALMLNKKYFLLICGESATESSGLLVIY